MAADDSFVPPPQRSEWLSPAQLPNTAAEAGTLHGYPSSMYELRPLTTSEIVDRTFTIYRSNFWLFAGIAAFAGVLQSIVAVAQMVSQGRILAQAQAVQQGRAAVPRFTGAVPLGIAGLASLLYFLAWSITLAAVVYALGEIYLGRQTSVLDSFRATIGRWYAYLGIAAWQIGSVIWLPLALIVPGMTIFIISAKRGAAFAVLGGILLFLGMTGGAIVGYIFYLRNSFGVQIAVLERSKVRPAMRRSKWLTSGAKWRILLVWLIAFALFMVVGIVQMPLAVISLMLMQKGGHALITQTISLFVNFVCYTVVTPVPMIGMALLYFDQRVRREAFDIAFLLGQEQALQADVRTDGNVGTQQATDAVRY